jgi:hypothetical protein
MAPSAPQPAEPTKSPLSIDRTEPGLLSKEFYRERPSAVNQAAAKRWKNGTGLNQKKTGLTELRS